MIRNVPAQAESRPEDVSTMARAMAVSAVRLRLADAQTQELLPDEEAALVERFASEAVLARPVPAALREALIRQGDADVSRACAGAPGPWTPPCVMRTCST